MKNTRLKNILRKTCAVFIVGVIVANCFIIPAKKVEAVPAEITADPFQLISNALEAAGNAIMETISAISTAVIGEGVAALETKEYIIDPIFSSMAKIALRAITSSIVSWAANGFNGSPSFIQNPGKFFVDVADQEIGKFLYNHPDYNWMCSPFRFQIQRAIIFNRSFTERSQCTLSGVVGNFEGFISSTNNVLGDLGGWRSWVQITTVPQNNPYGSYALAQVQLEAQISGSIQRNQSILNWGQGFLSWKDPACTADVDRTISDQHYSDDITEGGGEAPEQVSGARRSSYDECKTLTPGSVISEQINKTIGSGQDQLVAADEIDEVIGAVIQGLVINILGGGGLAGAGGNSGGNSNYQAQLLAEDQQYFAQNKADAAADVEERIQVENEYSQTKNQSIGRVDSSITLVQSLISCYSGSASSTTATSPFTQNDVAAASSTISSISSYKTNINRDIAISEVNIRNLQKVTTAINSLTYEQRGQLPTVMSQFTTILGQIHNEGDVIQAQYDRDYGLPNTLADVDKATNERIDSCREIRSLPPIRQRTNDE